MTDDRWRDSYDSWKLASPYDDEPEHCDRCQNTGWVECYCGGDLCVCENNGERECPKCHGRVGPADDDYDPGRDM